MQFLKKPIALFSIISVCILIAGVIYVHAGDDAPVTGISSVISVAQAILLFASLAALGANIVWSFFNRKQYDKLKEAIEDQSLTLESKRGRIEQLEADKLQLKDEKEALRHANKKEIEILEASNGALAFQNTAYKLILRKLRLEGKWQGDEENPIYPHTAEESEE